MRVHLSFDVEVWCNGWDNLDAEFAQSFSRYILGRSPAGDWGLPKTVDILQSHGLCGVFFVEPLFADRFGAHHLAAVLEPLVEGGQDVQLHLHPEWVNEIRPALIPDCARKRQHLCHYTLDEQTALLAHGKQALERATGRTVTAFRAGSYAANADTFEALARNALFIDSSLNACFAISGQGVPDLDRARSHRLVGAVTSYPITVFLDGTGRRRPLQLAACSFSEMRAALDSAHAQGRSHAVIVSHSFELLKDRRSTPDPIMVQRFNQLCAYLAAHPDRFQVGPFDRPASEPADQHAPRVPLAATLRRHVEQAIRRVW